MAERTRVELVNEAASLLGKLVSGEALNAEDAQTIDQGVDAAIAETSRIVAIDPDAVPNMYFATLARIVAIHAAAKFGMSPLDMQAIAGLETRIRTLVASDAPYQPVKVDYY